MHESTVVWDATGLARRGAQAVDTAFSLQNALPRRPTFLHSAGRQGKQLCLALHPLIFRSAIPITPMKAILLALTAIILLNSCTTDTDELRYKLKGRNEKYIGRQERAKMRKDARQERTDAWFDRIMH
jgi:hypothetical protein